MRVAIIPDSDNCLNDTIFNSIDVRDNGYAHYKAIKSVIESHGGEVHTFDMIGIEETDRTVVFNYSAFPEKTLEAINTIGHKNVFAIVLEPPGVWPAYYDSDIRSCFGAYSLPVNGHQEYGDNIYLGFPSSPVEVEWFPWESKKLLVSITSCKLYQFPGGLHEERIRAIKYFQSSIPYQFDMYGSGWQSDRIFGWLSPHKIFRSYKGSVASKHETMRKYKFSLCYENTSIYNGYISEKIFDSMQSGCVPIYWGAPDIQKYVPETCFIDRRKFRTDSEVLSFITGMNKNEYSAYMESIRSFLCSESYIDRLPFNYANRIYSVIEKDNRPVNFTDEGMRKLAVLAALKKMKSRYINEIWASLFLFLSLARLKDWIQLIKQFIGVIKKRLGVEEACLYARMRRL